MQDHFRLYDLKSDNVESKDLASQYQELLIELKMILLRELDSDRSELVARR